MFALITTITFWASAFVGIREGLLSFSPGALALFRFAVASVCMAVIYCFLPNRSHIPWRDRLQIMLIGALGIGVYNLGLNYGELDVTAGVASFIIGLIPVVTVILSAAFFNERPSMRMLAGICVSMVGLGIIMLSEKQHIPTLAPIFCLLGSAVLGAFYIVLQKRFLGRYHVIEVTSWAIWGSTLCLMLFVPKLMHEVFLAGRASTAAVVYMGVFPAAIAYIAWGYVLKYVPASTAAMFLYGAPLVTIAMALVFLHEKVSFLACIGGVVAMFGGWTTSFFQKQKAVSP